MLDVSSIRRQFPALERRVGGRLPVFLEAIRDPEHERYDEWLLWVGGRFDPEAFSAATATNRMRRGLPNWREWV